MSDGEESRPAGRPAPRLRRVLAMALMPAVVGAVAVALAANLDWSEFYRVLLRSDLRWVLAALGLVGLAYLALSFSYVLVNRSFGIRLRGRDLLRIGLVTSALIASAGGVAGHSVRVWMMARRGVSASEMLAPALFHGYIESLLFFLFIPGGMVYLLLTHPWIARRPSC